MSYTGSLLNFISSSTSPYHTVFTAQDYLIKNDFEELSLDNDWKIELEKKYFVKYMILHLLLLYRIKPCVMVCVSPYHIRIFLV